MGDAHGTGSLPPRRMNPKPGQQRQLRVWPVMELRLIMIRSGGVGKKEMGVCWARHPPIFVVFTVFFCFYLLDP